MSNIKNVLICGLGALGGYYASKITAYNKIVLKILTDRQRLEKYLKTPRIINGKTYTFDYILPENKDFKADLIIIATKSNGLNDCISNIANFVKDDTIILPLLNGITSEEEIAKIYGSEKVLNAYVLGHTFFRKGNEITHDGEANIFFGSDIKTPEMETKIIKTSNFLDEVGINYKVCENIKKAQWLKFTFNCCANQISALTGKTFGEMLKDNKCIEKMISLVDEISKIALKEGVENTDDFWDKTISSFSLMIPEGKTSMLQDIEAGIKPEIELFSETVCKLGEKYGIKTPENKKIVTELYKKIRF